MKKLLCSAAVLGLALAATPANAQVSLELGGWFKGYGTYVDQDDDDADVNDVDMIRHTEIHFGGETTLDNGLTVGVHVEAEADGGDSFEVEESYAYFSGDWGRVNFGAEDGAAYLLQVAAPSADDNIDGLRQFVQPVNYTAAGALAAFTGAIDNAGVSSGGIDYDQDASGFADKLTYLSPVFNGFQLGGSYTPDAGSYADDFEGVRADTGETWEAAARYEGQFNNVGMILGAGYTDAEDAAEGIGGDQEAWNVGADFDIGPFGIGAAYLNNDFDAGEEEETAVVGADYTTGPFKLGVSYLMQDNTFGIDDVDTDRLTGGVVYTYGPGMTFRGSVSHIEHDDLETGTGDDIEATSLVVGTQINF
ncbi:MAG: porin [Alphaproteobacteria bacterium]